MVYVVYIRSMKRLILLIFLFISTVSIVQADHITGGMIYYTLKGVSGGQYTYSFTVKQFRRCGSRNFNTTAYIGVFNRGNYSRIQDKQVNLTREEELSYQSNDPCITNPPYICYSVGYYEFEITLPASVEGYIITSQVTFRVDAITNLVLGYDRIGATYTAEIPGTNTAPADPSNNSAKFVGSDLVVVCANNSFSYSFGAEDPDNDQLRYSFCDAYVTTGITAGGGGPGGGGNPSVPATSPPYDPVPYNGNFSGSLPLGSNVKIDPNTGLITGIAPPSGTYVVTVCVQEIRNGVLIATQRKDLQLNITACTIASATLLPEYMLCGNSQTLAVENRSNSPLISTYNWEFSDALGNQVYNTSDPVAQYTFLAAGTYTVKLVINRGQTCPDSTTASAKVYPGFAPAITTSGTCFNKPSTFTDNTTTIYGTVNSWNWDFGETSVFSDVATTQNAGYTYPSTGTKTVQLIVGNSVGCLDTVTASTLIFDKPQINLAYRDTLICPPDNLQLQASGTGIFSWSPTTNMTGANTGTPAVSPTATTKYYVQLNSDGCINTDSVLIRTVAAVSLQARADTTICQGDTIQLTTQSNGLRYTWTPAVQLGDPTAKSPVAVTSTTTTYRVTATISNCVATDDVVVSTVAYPVARAGADTTICFNASAQLHGDIDGSTFGWTPAATLTNAGTLDPVASPKAPSTAYILYAYDIQGCPKPGTDTVVVTMLADMNAFAGRDTAVVIGQPLQLNATGGTQYEWTPATGLSATNIPNPIASYLSSSNGIDYKLVVLNEAGCMDSATLRVKVFQTLPAVFVPTGFTPNNDGLNDYVRPISAGIQTIEYFRIFNRWGELVYAGNTTGKGWDGTINGKQQAVGVYVWIVKAKDYQGGDFSQSGTVTLIR